MLDSEKIVPLFANTAQSNQLEPTIFHEKWWLDITTKGQCKYAEVVKNGQVIAQLPYVLKNRFGLSIVDMPPLTHFLGPAIVDGQGKDNKKFLRRIDITRELIEQLPRTSSLYIKCHGDISDTIAFQNAGFQTSVQFTHEIPPQPIDTVWKNMRDKGRNGIKQARECLIIDRDVTAHDFLAFYTTNLAEQARDNYLDMDMVGTLTRDVLLRKRGVLMGARDLNGKLVAVIFCVWNDTSYFYLMSSRAKNAHRGAVSLLLWEAISDAMVRGLTFDFDGITDEGSARLAANFTAVVKPRYIVTRLSRPMRVWRALQSLRHEPNFFCR